MVLAFGAAWVLGRRGFRVLKFVVFLKALGIQGCSCCVLEKSWGGLRVLGFRALGLWVSKGFRV